MGTYQLFAKADGADQIAEALESNNTSPRSIQIGGDLIVSSLTAPAMAAAGGVISVTDTTANQGTATGRRVNHPVLSVDELAARCGRRSARRQSFRAAAGRVR